MRNTDRAVDLAAPLVDAALGAGLSRGVAGELVCVERGSPHVFVRRAVKTVRTRLDGEIDDASAGTPVLRVIEIGLDLEFLRGFSRRHVSDVAAPGVGVVRNPVDLILVDAALAAVDGKIGDSAVVERTRIEQAAGVGNARRQVHQRERIVAVQRQVGDLLAAHNLAEAAGRILDEGRVGYDRNLLCGAADLERNVDLRAIVHTQFDRAAAMGLESRVGDFERVDSRLQVGDLVAAFAVAHRPRTDARIIVGDGDARHGNGRPCGIGDRSEQSCPVFLRRQYGCEEKSE